ncbi:MAG: regulatory iron-sulfur-containing complex subunit RicT [Thermodesulfobacteriota bacterium]|nr:regulatory iron-sulfur-containing complex subunit RicT [Thermodesulfobacteriota bacterium]
MKKVVGITFKPSGKIYDFDCGAFVLNRDDCVIVQTEKGLGFGTVALPPVPFDERPPCKPLKKIFRLASEKDFLQRKKNIETENKGHSYCLKCIKELGLNMNLFSVEKAFDSNKLTFFFTSDGRVDFRQLVKMLVKELGARVEMRQVGIRNQAKMCGGIGRCGRSICCTSFLEKFGHVSIRMAKEQKLSLNPTKISGLCGRLMCCLKFEYETYLALNKKTPKTNGSVKTAAGGKKAGRHHVNNGQPRLNKEDNHEVETISDKLENERDF